MSDSPGHQSDPQSGEELRREVEARAARKLEARRETRRSIWFGLGTFGMIGWSVSIPTLIGVAIGWWLDQNYPSRYSCTLMCLVLGLALGCVMAWQWVQRESGNNHSRRKP
ncbi:MAG: AtpZ/AtpI family protein [Planctomycetaceae bacterium]|nr:AtpZ/AtpI family protein [Planctomycetaceae bacterium]